MPSGDEARQACYFHRRVDDIFFGGHTIAPVVGGSYEANYDIIARPRQFSSRGQCPFSMIARALFDATGSSKSS